MEIADIETFVVGTPAPHKGGRNWVFVKLTADDGTVGYGECNWAEYRVETLVQAIEELADRFVLGHDPFEIEQLVERLTRSSHFLHVPGPIVAQVSSSVEMACWDLLGKQVGEPVYRLLGGRYNERLRSYTYLHYEWEPPQPPEAAAAAARFYVDEGFTGLKFDPLHSIAGPRTVSLKTLEYAEDVVAAVREEVGDACDLMIGTHGQLHTQTAIRFARRIEKYDPLWLEEPVPPERSDAMARVADATSVPIATGERICSPHAMAELIESDAVDIVQPNVGFLGLLGARKAAATAESAYKQIAPWMYCGPVAGVANLHLDACSPNFLIQESIEDWDWFHNQILEDPVVWEDGDLVPPDRPGLGVSLDEAELRDHAYEPTPVPAERPHYSHEKNLEKMDAHGDG